MDFSGIIESISSRVPTDDNTYVGEDGLLYCKNCLTARQCRIEVYGKGVRTVNCLCKCMVEEREKEEERRKQQEIKDRIKRYRSIGFSDEEMLAHTFAVDDGEQPAITRAMKAYVSYFKDFRKDGKGLFLYGPVGTGKSFFAACVVNALIDEGYPCLMTNFSRLTNVINSTWDGKQDYIDSLSRFSLVAIDDLGVERDTQFMNETVTTIIDSLYRAKVPVIITSNYTPKQLTDEGDIRRRRVFDRLLERCHPIAITGESRRKQKGRSDYMKMKDILGV